MATLTLGTTNLSTSGGNWSDAPAGTIIQIVTEHGKTSFSSSSTSYVQTPVQCTITPRVTTSQILVRQCVSSWEGTGGYGHRQVRATGGYVNWIVGLMVTIMTMVLHHMAPCLTKI